MYQCQPIRRQVALLLMPKSTNEYCTVQYMQTANLGEGGGVGCGGKATALRIQSCMFYQIRQRGMQPAAPGSSVPDDSYFVRYTKS
jgi:hypothetical protein